MILIAAFAILIAAGINASAAYRMWCVWGWERDITVALVVLAVAFLGLGISLLYTAVT